MNKIDLEYLESCTNMAKLIESCYDSNNPDDGLSFDERLARKVANLEGMDLKAIQQVMVNV